MSDNFFDDLSAVMQCDNIRYERCCQHAIHLEYIKMYSDPSNGTSIVKLYRYSNPHNIASPSIYIDYYDMIRVSFTFYQIDPVSISRDLKFIIDENNRRLSLANKRTY